MEKKSSSTAARKRTAERFSEQEAVEAVLRAMKEPTLSGDLDELAKNLR